MSLWRFTAFEALDGRGGLLASGRWHTRGRAVLYCAANPATAVLEVLVRAGVRSPRALGRHYFLKLAWPDSLVRETVEPASLPALWSEDLTFTRGVGDRWLREGRSAALLVPSVLVPETMNVLINPAHVGAGQVVLEAVYPFPLDPRLFGG